MAKKIRRGEFKGLKELTESELEIQEISAKNAEVIPTKKVVISTGKERNLTPNWCKNGDIDRCPAPCGACVDNPHAGPLKVWPAKILTLLDAVAYNKQALLMN